MLVGSGCIRHSPLLLFPAYHCSKHTQSRNHRVWISAIAQSSVLQYQHMNKEKPQVISPRVYKEHRDIIRTMARRLKISHAEVVRRAIKQYSSCA